MRHPATRLASFLVLAVAGYFLTGSIARTPLGFSALLAALLLIATIACARINKESLADLGFSLSRQRLHELGFGFGVASGVFAAIALIFGLAPGASWRDAAFVLVLAPCLFLAEELLFRGYAFQQIVRLAGPGAAVVLTAAAFGAYHQLMAGVFLMPALGGLVFGYALVRSGGLALPIGLHWGGNWVQALTPEAMPRVPYILALGLMALTVRLVTRDARPA